MNCPARTIEDKAEDKIGQDETLLLEDYHFERPFSQSSATVYELLVETGGVPFITARVELS